MKSFALENGKERVIFTESSGSPDRMFVRYYTIGRGRVEHQEHPPKSEARKLYASMRKQGYVEPAYVKTELRKKKLERVLG